MRRVPPEGGGGGGGGGGSNPPPTNPPPTTTPRGTPQRPRHRPPLGSGGSDHDTPIYDWNPDPPDPNPPPPTRINPSPKNVNRTTPEIRKREIPLDDVQGAIVPVQYGPDGGASAMLVYRNTDPTGRYLYCAWVRAVGPCNLAYDLKIDGHTPEECGLVLGSTYHIYTGESDQGIDPLIPLVNPNWKSQYPGIVYATGRLDGAHPIGGKVNPRNATLSLEGLLVRDPRSMPKPDACSVAAGAAGVLTGTFEYLVTFMEGADESAGGAVSSPVTLTAEQSALSAIPVGVGIETARRIYRRDVNTIEPFQLVDTIPDNVTTTFSDNVAAADLGQEPPYVATKRAYSTTAVLAHFDFRTSRRYGFNEPDNRVDWDTVEDAADDCDFPVAPGVTGPVAAPTISLGAAYSGQLILGKTYEWLFTYVVDGKETGPSPASASTVATLQHQKATVTIDAGPTGTTSRRIYRNKGYSGGTTLKYLAVEIFDNTTLTWDDTLSDHGLQTTIAPSTNLDSARYAISMWLVQPATLQDWDSRFRAIYQAWLTYDTQWRVYVDLPRTPSGIVFDTTNIIGDIEIDSSGLASKFSKVTCRFNDVSAGFKENTTTVEHPYYALPPTELEREERREAIFELGGSPTWDQTKRINVQIFNRARLSKRVRFRAFLRGLRVMPGIVVEVTHPTGPLSNTPVIVTDCALSADGEAIDITGEFYLAEVYLDTPQYNPVPIIPPVPSPFDPPYPPTNVTAETVIESGTSPHDAVGRIRIGWTPSDNPFYRSTRVEYSTDGGSMWVQHGEFSLGECSIEQPRFSVEYQIRLYTRLVTFVESVPAEIAITPEFIDGTIPEVTQGQFLGNRLEFYGPIPQVAPLLVPIPAPTLATALAGFGGCTDGQHGIMIGYVMRGGELYFSLPALITTSAGSNRIDVSVIDDGPPGALFAKVYMTKADLLDDYYHVSDTAIPAGTDQIQTPDSSLLAEDLEPVEFAPVNGWEVLDWRSGAEPAPLFAAIRPGTPPHRYARLDCSSLVYADPTTQEPRIDVLVRVVSRSGARSTGKVYSQPLASWPPVQSSAPPDSLPATITLSNGQNDDVVLPNDANFVYIEGPTAAFSISGFSVEGSPPLTRKRIVLFNTVAFRGSLLNENASSDAENRLKVPGAGDYDFGAQNGSVTIEYDLDDERWAPIALNLAGTGPAGGGSVTIRKNSGANVGTRPRVNLIEGTGITLAVADDGTANELDVTITGGGADGKSSFGAYASRPAGIDGDAYQSTDCPTHSIKAGGVWRDFVAGMSIVAPNDASFAWVNQGASTVAQVGSMVRLSVERVFASHSLRIRKKSAPSTPYVITALINPGFGAVSDVEATQLVGILFREAATGEIHSFAIQTDGNRYVQRNTKWSSATALSAEYQAAATNPWVNQVMSSRSPFGIWFRIADDGTNRKCFLSVDGGYEFREIHSVGRTDFLTADEVGWFGYANTGTETCKPMLISWEET